MTDIYSDKANDTVYQSLLRQVICSKSHITYINIAGDLIVGVCTNVFIKNSQQKYTFSAENV